jgi:uncharacterized membrane protein
MREREKAAEGEKGRKGERESVPEDIAGDASSLNSPSPLLPLSLSSSIAAVVALIGLGDALYLTAQHLRNEVVPCSLISGCEVVLTSEYATIVGIPLAALGAIAYFVAFSLAILTAFGNSKTWFWFGIQVVLMSLFTLWLLYLQAFIIGAFCQFCLLSALVTFTLLIIALISKFWRWR